ncbi:MAG: hypothetical protein COX02_00195 [Candidatus Vogelbacteria bacterium CG22_combo_CG10-13_8_21_14_all_37_9]|uniref:Uncharacterized protein n=1 Tax=Candidatus Vogelbacteria bacterium CG22_combo_CG10-13_8_21_14_all_37_9 TaxID=1975046 RepID=A0A2H0BLF4_9BACT|nr:MAG: hypothetical protein COX02_00195 [Candidatus Vogelbacteria bacterium CG22_combo_CG10-13_8_21_14_all_37_9]
MNIGLTIITGAWLWLVYCFWKKGERGFNPWFLRLYVVGSLIIFLETYQGLMAWISWISFLNLSAPIYILWKNKRK